MCKIADYPELYAKANEILRRDRISPKVVGYELLRRAIVIQSVEGKVSLEEIEKGQLIPSNKDINLKKKKRSSAMQWMIEAIKSAGIGEEQNESVEVVLKNYIKQCANELNT